MTFKYAPSDASKAHPLHTSAQKISDAISDGEYSNAADVEADQLTPTWKKFTPKFNSAVEVISKALTSGEAPSFEELKALASTLITPDNHNSEKDLIAISFQYLEEASEGDEGISENIRKSLVPLFLAILESSNLSANLSIKTEKLRIRPLINANNDKSKIIERAKVIAKEKWVTDIEKKIRTGEMADKVWSQLVDEGRSQHLPDNVERVKVWIRGVAPEYASAKGRKKKGSA